MLAVIETHPVQYHAPVYRAVVGQWGIPVTAVYGSDFSVAGYHDEEFGAAFAWDTDLLSGYESVFLSRAVAGGGRTAATTSARGVSGALRRVAPRAVLLVGYSPRFHRIAWWTAWRGGYPLLFRGETNDASRDRSTVFDGVRAIALRTAYRTCRRCLYIGRRSREHFERHGVPPERLVSSPYCVDETTFDGSEEARARWRSVVRRELDIAEEARVLVYVGKLSRRKGVDLLVPALRALAAAGATAPTLLVVGDGDLRAVLERQAASPPEVPIRLVGFRNQRALSRFYHAADALVLPSRHGETWGLVVNEALLHGVPCVVSERVGCWPDLVVPGQTGAVCAPDSAENVAGAITSVLSLIGRADTRLACRQRVEACSVQAAARGLAEAYRAVTGSGGHTT